MPTFPRLLLVLALAVSSLRAEEAVREVTILYTNDFHGAVDPIPAYWVAGCPRLGGAAELSAKLAGVEPWAYLKERSWKREPRGPLIVFTSMTWETAITGRSCATLNGRRGSS